PRSPRRSSRWRRRGHAGSNGKARSGRRPSAILRTSVRTRGALGNSGKSALRFCVRSCVGTKGWSVFAFRRKAEILRHILGERSPFADGISGRTCMLVSMLADYGSQMNPHDVGAMLGDAAIHGKLALKGASDKLVILAQPGGDISVEQFKEKLNTVTQEEQLGWLASIGKYFIGIFQKGGEVFAGFVTGIIPTLVVLMTAFYAITELVGEERVHGVA